MSAWWPRENWRTPQEPARSNYSRRPGLAPPAEVIIMT
jgi:hypothetical protein